MHNFFPHFFSVVFHDWYVQFLCLSYKLWKGLPLKLNTIPWSSSSAVLSLPSESIDCWKRFCIWNFHLIIEHEMIQKSAILSPWFIFYVRLFAIRFWSFSKIILSLQIFVFSWLLSVFPSLLLIVVHAFKSIHLMQPSIT